jgi:formyl-CoA transferase
MGRLHVVLVEGEGKSPGTFTGRTDSNQRVVFPWAGLLLLKGIRADEAAALARAKVDDVDDVLAALDSASVPSGRIYTVADIAADPHYRARDMLQDVALDDGSTLTLPGIVPKLSATPGSHRRNAPTLGQDTGDVLRDIGLTEAQIVALRERGIVN